MTARRRVLLGGVLSVVLAASLSGCATRDVEGEAHADTAARQDFLGSLFEERMAAATEQFSAGTDVAGLEYVSTVGGADDFDLTREVTLLGDPATVVVRESSSREGDTIDVYHEGGSDSDFLLLGSKFAELSPTLWTEVPTVIGADDDPCLLPAERVFCGASAALEADDAETAPIYDLSTDEEGVSRISVTTSLANIAAQAETLDLPSGLLDPDGIEDGSVATITIQSDAEGAFNAIELSASLGEDGGRLLVGFESTGAVDEDELPEPPSPFDVTTIDASDVDAFYEEIQRLRDE
ncbi:hypothetical protein CLV49_0801 [Labedella gwakjiensis]|uniref:Lipoprotein n=1 Tax=Labedella gwakjiensis TaxID=390269 RepID=A0A2P8GTA7_9MICO|nr:hypothetical protein [Labedella gwakjiensis]PSL37194.1 hypothetical protein CLV49_0801 [Labedella gwakjiensis]RUQ81911.1 hypothetical protein ELQ93_16595 [Labedella gwakjiensis]